MIDVDEVFIVRNETGKLTEGHLDYSGHKVHWRVNSFFENKTAVFCRTLHPACSSAIKEKVTCKRCLKNIKKLKQGWYPDGKKYIGRTV